MHNLYVPSRLPFGVSPRALFFELFPLRNMWKPRAEDMQRQLRFVRMESGKTAGEMEVEEEVDSTVARSGSLSPTVARAARAVHMRRNNSHGAGEDSKRLEFMV